jgi:two-component system chemotaxis response regulator CheY
MSRAALPFPVTSPYAVAIAGRGRDGGVMSKCALVVDDSLSVRKLVGNLLKKNGFEVVEAGDGKQAVEKLDAQPLSLIITDINMPVMDGIEFIKAVRGMEAYKYTPILCLTTETDDSKKNEGRDAGATGWVIKPFDGERLLRAVQKVVG